jgi:hypothetical protein
MIHEDEIRSRLIEYLAGSVSLSDFARSINSPSWSMFSDGSEQAAINLVAAASLRVSELYDGIINEQQLHAELLALLNNISDAVAISDERVVRVPQLFSARAHWAPEALPASI